MPKVYFVDEVICEILTKDIPKQYIASGITFRHLFKTLPPITTGANEMLDDIYYVAAVEGFFIPVHDPGMVEHMLDDEEYPANREISRHPDGTLELNARFGRNKRWAMFINRADDAAAEKHCKDWLRELGSEGDAMELTEPEEGETE